MLHFAATMRNAVERGLATDDRLPGGQGRPHRAATQAVAISGTDPALAAWAAVFATAVAEENAAGGRVVAAPSNGSAGPVAAVLHQWRSPHPLAGDDGSVTFLLAAAAVGQLLRTNGLKHAGCQGEIGVASAMAAAGLAAVNSASNRQLLYAAERALEPFVGLTCDPIGGLVQPATRPPPRTPSTRRALRCACRIRRGSVSTPPCARWPKKDWRWRAVTRKARSAGLPSTSSTADAATRFHHAILAAILPE